MLFLAFRRHRFLPRDPPPLLTECQSVPADLASSSIGPLYNYSSHGTHCLALYAITIASFYPLFLPFRPFHTAHVLPHIPSVAYLERIVQATTMSPTPLLAYFPPQVSQRRSSPKFEPFFPDLVYYTLPLLFFWFSLFLPVVSRSA
ncbi:hypothetical protein BJX68DRAFT_142595 [Aspergillus pseudodeflectus]|uniref:Uncharacterized protein n=1 Tax=Aspergillus pseudodeflectus TaxID=176178 RepID=A0ABR4L2T0_9EURO